MPPSWSSKIGKKQLDLRRKNVTAIQKEPVMTEIPPIPQADSPDMLIEAAMLYYEEHLTQSEIGRRLNTSRSTISRWLKEARNKGLVQITINYSWARNSQLEDALKAQFSLKDAYVLRTSSQNNLDITNGIGILAAKCLQATIEENMILGVSYGRSIAATIRNLEPQDPLALTVVQILGALGADNPLIESAELTRNLASKYGAQYRYLYAPLMVEDKKARDIIMQEPLVNDVITIGKLADVVLLGIGSLEEHATNHIWRGYLNTQDFSKLKQAGAVGNMCAQFFDDNGTMIDTDFNHRSISIGLDSLKKISNVIAVASGIPKVNAIRGALLGKYVTILVTDDMAAKELLLMEDHIGLA